MTNWLKDIQNKMDGFEMKAPEGLWEDLSVLPQVAAPGRSAHHFPWVGYLAGAFAVAVALFLLLRPVPANHLPEMMLSENRIFTIPPVEVVEAVVPAKPVAPVEPANPSAPVEPAASIEPEVPNEPAAPSVPHVPSEIPEFADEGELWVDADAHAKKITLSVAGALNANSSVEMSYHGAAFSASGPQDAVWADSPLLAIMTYNRGSESRKLSHHTPLRVALMAGYPISDRWSIEAGLSYVNLVSDVWHGGTTGNMSGAQRLEYVGVPIAIRWSAFRKERLDIYASAGLNLDKCISGKMTSDFSINGAVWSKVERYSERPFQLSSTLSGGVSYSIDPLVSIYAEPGVSYYFDDGSTLETIYKTRPLNFSINVGLRFTFGD